MKRKRIALALAAALAAAVVSGCSAFAASRQAAAVEQAIVEYKAHYFEVENLSEQLREQMKEKGNAEGPVTYTIHVQLPDVSTIDPDGISYETPAYDLNAPDASAFINSLRQAFAEGVAQYAGTAQIQDFVEVPVDVTLTESEGEWTAHITESSTQKLAAEMSAMVDEVLETADLEPEIRTILSIAEQKEDLLGAVFGSTAYAGEVKIEDMEMTAADTCTMTISYPDPADVYAALAQREIDGYSEAVFGEVSVNLQADTYFTETLGTPTYKTSTIEIEYTDGFESGDAMAAGTGADAITLEIEEARTQAEQEAGQAITAQWAVLPAHIPQTGVLSGESRGNDVIIKTSSDSGDYCVRFYELSGADYTADGTFVLSAFIRGGERYTVRLPVGNYKLIYGTGDTWYGDEHMFGPDGSYNRMDGVVQSQNGYYTELTLYIVEGGNTGLTPVPFPG